jgi:4-hydroxybenzoate polyprenyltransferase/phosphoserine phosphatase
VKNADFLQKSCFNEVYFRTRVDPYFGLQLSPLSMTAQTTTPLLLCVDLDGTLVSTDTLDECLLRMVRHRPLLLFRLPFWMLRGKAYFKDRVAAATVHLLGPLPYRQSVLEYIRTHANGGEPVVLATAANRRIAEQVSNELGLFTKVMASDERLNLSGVQKLSKMREFADGRPIAYIGDHAKDIPIWLGCERAIVAGGSQGLAQRIAQGPEVIVIPPDRQPTVRDWMRQLRCHQWSKNLLLIAPLILAHQVTSLPAVMACLVAVIAFSLTASAVYIGNDLVDLPHDRKHVRKRNRPLASGVISIRSAVAAGAGLLAAGFGISLAVLPLTFVWMLLGYVVLNIGYSIWFKRIAVLDVLLLAGFYVYRVLIGAVAIQALISPWLLAFSMFFFLGLGMVKRFADLLLAASNEQASVSGRSYVTGDVDFVRSVGTSSSCVAVLVLALYLQSAEVTHLYKRPEFLWLACPLVLFWTMRAWFIANRGEMSDDPILFALRDPASYAVGAITAVLLVLATL